MKWRIRHSSVVYYSFLTIIIIGCNKEDTITPVQAKSSAVFNPQLTYGTLTDQEGNNYKTIMIGLQTWMAENLRTTKYRNGDVITMITNNSSWAAAQSGAYCNYNNSSDANFIATYGLLYNWYAITDFRNITPEGWHIPSDEEWATLIEFLEEASTCGGKLKEEGTLHWNSPNTGASNESGFTALPGGLRHYDGSFGMLREHGSWWSTNVSNNGEVWIRDIYYQSESIGRYEFAKTSGFSIRCIKD